MFRKSKIFFMITLILCFALTLPAYASRVTAGDVIVVMKDAQTASSSSVSISAQTARVSALASSVNAKVAKTYPALSEISDGKIFALIHSDAKSETQLIKELQANPDVLGVSLNYKVRALAAPNDPYYTNGKLWGLDAIKANKVWDKGYTGSNSVYSAIIDTGVLATHADLSANFHSGKGFVGSSTSYTDGNGHGTHVAGTIAGVGNNSTGVTGINWTAKIIALKALGNNGEGELNDVIAALNYVASLTSSTNIAAVNLSLGYYVKYTPAQMISRNDPTYLALKALSDKNKSVICVAAGNENVEVGKALASNLYDEGNLIAYKGDYCYPASFTNISNMIVVAAANNNSSYTRASFSNYSTSYVDIAAPGVGILSTYTGN
ncbi:MAG: S8 family serine peptidase, partial [Synergistaceae bacterium]|nr:S8 family serine peptidase [Synergistaceae bacterium]